MRGSTIALASVATIAGLGLLRRGSRAVDAVRAGDVVHFLLGWDPKKHPTVTGTVLHPYAAGERDEWIVRYEAADGRVERVAVALRSMRPGPAPSSVVPFRPRGSKSVRWAS